MLHFNFHKYGLVTLDKTGSIQLHEAEVNDYSASQEIPTF